MNIDKGIGEFDSDQMVLFHYSETRAGETAKEFLDGFQGYLMTDGYGGYNKLKKCKRTSCWAHVRRYLIDAIPKGLQYDYSLPAVQGLVYVDKLFEMERKIHMQKGVSFDAVKDIRIEKEKPMGDVSMGSFLEGILFNNDRKRFDHIKDIAAAFTTRFVGDNIIRDDIFAVIENYVGAKDMPMEWIRIPIEDDELCACTFIRGGRIFVICN